MINPLRINTSSNTKAKRTNTILSIGGIAGAVCGYCIPVYKNKDCEDIIYNTRSPMKKELSKTKITLVKKQCKMPNYPLKALLMLLGGFAGLGLTNFIVKKYKNQ